MPRKFRRVFESQPTSDTGPARYGEPHLDYISRTGRPAFVEIRDLIERWAAEIVHPHRREMIARLRSRDNNHFDAAFFELYLHAMLRRLGCRVRCHPKIGRQPTRPDFLVTDPRGNRMLVEAVTFAEKSAADRAARARLDEVYNTLNRVHAPDYFFHIEDCGDLGTPLPGKKLRHAVRTFLATLDYDRVRELATQNDLGALPRMHFDHAGFKLELSVLPVSPAHRGDPKHRPVGIMGAGVAMNVDDRTPLREAIRSKAGRYGRPRCPILVAVNAAGRTLDKTDIMEALFGQETFTFAQNREPELHRRPDGAWSGPHGPRNRRVSAVLVVSALLPWTVTVHEPIVYHNPWAKYPASDAFAALQQFRPVGDQMVEHPGRAAHSILDLPERWPHNLE